MTRWMMAVLMLAGSLPAYAAEKSYEASASVRYVDLDSKGNKGGAMEYDGKIYKGVHGDVGVSNEGPNGLFDFQARDLGSNEESADLELSYKSNLQVRAKLDTLHHRQNFIRSGMIMDGYWQPMPVKYGVSISTGDELLFRRTEGEVGVNWRGAEDTANWISLDYWAVEKKGGRAVRSTSNMVNAGNVSNVKQDLTLGVGLAAGDDGAVSVDLVHSSFQDEGSTAPWRQDALAIVPLPRQEMNAAEFKFRYNAGKAFSLTGAFTGRRRENLDTTYKTDTVVAALNAAYRASEKLSLLARLYLRAYQVDESHNYRGPTTTLRFGNYNQMDKTSVRGEFSASYRPVEPVSVKAGYKAEMSHRRDAPTLALPAQYRYYADGTVFSYGGYSSSVAPEDVKHTGSLGLKAELPFGIEAEADYKKLQANRSSLGNTANRRDDVNGSLTVPLPLRTELTLVSGYVQETGNQAPWNHRLNENTYRGSLDWDASNQVFLGIDGSYETIRYFTDGWIGEGGTTAAAGTAAAAWHESGMKNHQKNTAAGVHGRIVLPKGFVVSGNGSYVWAMLSTPMHWNSGVGIVGDDTPNDTRIARGTLALEYTPEKFKNITARGSYSIEDWHDMTDSNNNGRASVGQLGVTAKF
ncbi:MAG: hypothetical protein WC969_00235 [Elusimicrobiota bacterium]|jgi:hypothetical protein